MKCRILGFSSYYNVSSARSLGIVIQARWANFMVDFSTSGELGSEWENLISIILFDQSYA